MKRREFIGLIGGAAAAWPLAANAQQKSLPVVGLLNGGSVDDKLFDAAAFRKGLSQTGHFEGRNVLIEYRWAEGQYDRVPAMVADLVDRQVAVIFTSSTPAILAAKAATSTIPIVFLVGGNPVEMGLVASLNRSGSNLTGVTNLAWEVGPKRLEILHELVPTAINIAVLVNPASVALAEPQTRALQAAAPKLGLQLHFLNASTEGEIDAAFAALAQRRADGLVIVPDTFFNVRHEQLAALALRHALPTIYQFRDFAAAGGLMSYGTNLAEMFYLIGVYIGRVLNGERPADLPVQQATKVELIINLKTAKALGLTVPASLLGRADEVVE
ncbi:MAG TPA: ABC transporter substrate-binding protein [Bradyrhizobium sp.]|nr:ABC transporter substrate-binding protein [Bradyrhizobium sp.]